MAFSPVTQAKNKSWYSAGAGRIFLFCLGLFFLIIIAFFILVGVYSQKIGRGEGAQLYNTIARDAVTDLGVRGGAEVIDTTKIIRPENPTLGNSDAPVTIVMFIDFECPFCQASYQTIETLQETYPGILRIVFKHLPVAELHPRAIPASLAAACAHAQKAFWPYYRALFTTKELSDVNLLSHAQTVGINEAAFATCVDRRVEEAVIQNDLQDAVSVSVGGTPTYFVNGRRIQGAQSATAWEAIILNALRERPVAQ